MDTTTRKRDLRDSMPLWAATPSISVITSKSAASRSYDVVIVGAGISGALVAEALADGRRSILVIDRRKPVTGSTMASTAMIQHEIDVPLSDLSRMIGEEKAARAWRRSAASVKALSQKVKSLDLVCSWRDKQTLYLAGEGGGARKLSAEFRARQSAGLEVGYVDGDTVKADYGIDREAALLSQASASGNPAQLAAGLLRAARARGVEIVEGVEITDLSEFGDRAVLATSSGSLIDAGHVVFCTGYEFLERVQQKGHSIASTWALATPPGLDLPGWLSDTLVWEAADPYLYFRMTRDGRLIAGGEDEGDPESYHSEAKMLSKPKRILEKLSDLLGVKLPDPEFTWSAGFGLTPTGLPYIDRVPGMSRVFAVMGFGGNGITFSQIASELIAGEIGGKPDPDRDLFRIPA
ncbi:glycine/D-amino acid oxidase-like deaminating enzyme [Hoeflea marina]|uniref:Glycine/D-amino acid oxidase-like deaminating enzyme n=1 Tax=Hoeflea marina TaxID=274592 RepID=A0A317PMA7_9HYPH|nr:FAD-binding oxidoreductase [Hoeflea marina]PWW01896.1 glycine/D-amino acid oxidase-like deaminating enzyme [Hoeflea marina]